MPADSTVPASHTDRAPTTLFSTERRDPATGAERFDIQASIVQPVDEDARAMRTVAKKESVN